MLHLCAIDVLLPLFILLDRPQRHAAQLGKLPLAQAVLLAQYLKIGFRLRSLNQLVHMIGELPNVHLVIDMMVQAIPAPVDNNGNILDNDDNQGYIRAWVKAIDKTSPNDLLEL